MSTQTPTQVTVDSLFEEAVQDFDVYVGCPDVQVQRGAYELVDSIAYDAGGVSDAVCEATRRRLVAWAEEQARKQERDERLALQDAREAGDVDDFGEFIPYS